MNFKYKNNFIFLSLIFFIVLNDSQAQNRFNPPALQEDLTVVKEIINELSPKLTDKDRQRINDLARIKSLELADTTFNSIEFFNFLATIDFQTKFDEHASLSITEEVIMPLLASSQLFPLPLKIISGNMVVVNSERAQIPFGSRIHSINGMRLDSLLKSFTVDYEDTYKMRNLERQFSIMYLIKKGNCQTFDIDFVLPLEPNSNLTQTITGIDFNTYQELFQEPVYPLDRNQLSNLINTKHYPNESTYYLQLNSFNWDKQSEKGFSDFMNSEHKNFDQRFKSIFKEISESGVQNLIIDLRFNRGGNVRVPGTLFKYIAQNQYTENVRIEIQDFDIPHKELIKAINGEKINNPDEVERFIKRYEKHFVQQMDSTYVWHIVENEVSEPSKYAFNGNVYLLVGGRSISASSYFAALFKSADRGTIVGEKMGGAFQSLSAGKILTYQLPNTLLELGTPIMLVNFPDELVQIIGTDRIVPDVLFDEQERLKYLVEKKDIEIEKTLQRIQENN